MQGIFPTHWKLASDNLPCSNMVFLKIPALRKRNKVTVRGGGSVITQFVPSTKQKKGYREQIARDDQEKLKVRGVGEGDHLRQVMGGGSVESGGDGTGWAGGITLDYWTHMLRNLHILREMLGREPNEGQDFPSEGQMSQARKFYRDREKR